MGRRGEGGGVGGQRKVGAQLDIVWEGQGEGRDDYRELTFRGD